ncbi:hypothetical protein [Aliiglaciecola sp. LCG003]|uniref:hypothetical protein n=1 Tax=Aliiglaciecola sp. LCG003 TaxID=3053655 RepID=UPI0025743793|nr:hypothetical protein [Aliiglaciecola sp. LCG003]WJG07964.1 hypothetical protein QR722_11380 [Aliiglaciecola sp. LCG003]
MRWVYLFIFIVMTQNSVAQEKFKLDVFDTEFSLEVPYLIKGPFRNGTVSFIPVDENSELSGFVIHELKEGDQYCSSNGTFQKKNIRYAVLHDVDRYGDVDILMVCDRTNFLIVNVNDLFAKQIINHFNLIFE